MNCFKVETENGYMVKDARTGRQLLIAKEDSVWCARNPCICCDCNCWCFDCNCSSRRPFTLTLMEDEGSPMVLEMSRPLASDCVPGCLQSIVVRDQTHPLGSVNQVKHTKQLRLQGGNNVLTQVLGYAPPFNMCGKFEVRDADGDVQFVIQVPCIMTTCCCTQVLSSQVFSISTFLSFPRPTLSSAT